jgi:signal peptidase I
VFREVRIFALMILIISSLRSSLADWNDVPTGSMKPTIQEGDRVVVNKLAYDLKVPFTTRHLAEWDNPKRGDIVVFFSPADGVRLVKRVIGLPGDQVSMQNNRLTINGVEVPWTPPETRNDSADGMTLVSDETLSGRIHKVMVTPAIPSLRTFDTVEVPVGHYFVMGDNRDNSNDSRFIGFIERKRIVGEAFAVAFSLDRNQYYMPRGLRFFLGVDGGPVNFSRSRAGAEVRTRHARAPVETRRIAAEKE